MWVNAPQGPSPHILRMVMSKKSGVQRISVLCVDDEPNILEGLRLQMGRTCRLLTAGGGAEALEILKSEPGVGVVLTDMRMPGMDGAEFLERAAQLVPDAASILLTGQCDVTAAMRAINQGRVSWFLLKPCARHLLVEAVANAASTHRLRAVQRLLTNTERQPDRGVDAAAREQFFLRIRAIFGTRYAAMAILDEAGTGIDVLETDGLDPGLFRRSFETPSLLSGMEPGAPACLLQPAGDAIELEGLPAGHPKVAQFLGIGFGHGTGRRGWLYFADGGDSLRFGAPDVQAITLLGTAMERFCTGEAEGHDALTGLVDRECFLSRGADLPDWTRAGSGRCRVMVLDICHFRYLNETLGRDACDRILQFTARLLEQQVGKRGIVARIGGDRFAALFMESEDEVRDPAGQVTAAVRKALETPLLIGGQPCHISATIGLSALAEPGEDVDTLVRHAEAAMKGAKAEGDRVRVYSRELGATIAQGLEINQRLYGAIERGEFSLHYQPKIDVRSNRIVASEALLRWNSPAMGNVSPVRFIPILEESGLIIEVGKWVIRKALADHACWTAQGLNPAPIAVNVSPLQLRNPSFADEVASMLSEHPGAPGISLEITESILASGTDDTIRMLRTLRGLGLSIAIDDFGTGYSSLAYLTRLPIDTVKIDRSFIIRMTDDADSLSVVSAIISLARTLGFKIVAEGVDTQDQLKLLRLLRCDEYQGYLFSPGVAAPAFLELLCKGRAVDADLRAQAA